MGRPDRLCVLCNDHVQETEEPHRTWKTHLLWSESVAICWECIEVLREITPPDHYPYWKTASDDERA